jgi:hypothetical protein
MSIRQYSTYFSCLHDEPEPVGQIGEGTHYSVMRAVEWSDECLTPIKLPQVHDFAVIWNEFHDERVISTIEQIYMAGLLSPVLFVSLQKHTLYFVLTDNFWGLEEIDSKPGVSDSEIYSHEIDEVCTSDFVHATVFCTFEQLLNLPDSAQRDIISDDEHRVHIYLRNIDNLWKLGSKPFSITAYDERAAFSEACFQEGDAG